MAAVVKDVTMAWPTPTSESSQSVQMGKSILATFTVPTGEPTRCCTLVVSATGSSTGEEKFTMVLSETPGGPPMQGLSVYPSSSAPRMVFYVNKDPYGGIYPVVKPGNTYYATTTVKDGNAYINVQLLAYAPS